MKKGLARALASLLFVFAIFMTAMPAHATFIQFYKAGEQDTTDVSTGKRFVLVGNPNAIVPIEPLLQIGEDSANPITFSKNAAGNLDINTTNLNITTSGVLSVNGNAVATGVFANQPNTVPQRGPAGELNIGAINSDGNFVTTGTATATSFIGDLTGTVQTAAQPNITSVGTLTGLTMGGNIVMGSNKLTGLGDATASGEAATFDQVGSRYIATVELVMPAEADPTNPVLREVNTTTALSFPAGALAGKTLEYAVSDNTSPQFRFNFPNKSINVGFQNATGGDPTTTLGVVPNTNGNILYGVEDLGGGQYRFVLQRLADNQPGYSPVFAGPLTFSWDVFGK